MFTVMHHFQDKDPHVYAIYSALIAKLSKFGDIHEAAKQTSIHLENTSGFAGVYTRKNYIILHFRLSRRMESPRITNCKQLSASRFKHTVKLSRPEDVDNELMVWLKDAYDLAKR